MQESGAADSAAFPVPGRSSPFAGYIDFKKTL